MGKLVSQTFRRLLNQFFYSPVSVQPSNLKSEASKGQENGHAASDVDEATLRKGEVQYGTYFQQRNDLPTNAQGLVAFH
jgi:pre-mRNA-processing factor 39